MVKYVQKLNVLSKKQKLHYSLARAINTFAFYICRCACVMEVKSKRLGYINMLLKLKSYTQECLWTIKYHLRCVQ